MYLKRLEVYGFKSFGSKSVLDFTRGKEVSSVAAIVGPNGSGKSNVADAVRWVLGEQSSKLLRSKKSEDVIFFGSDSKSRSSYAEISIVLADHTDFEIELNNKKHKLSEIEIARKLYRSGESEYLINGKKVRLIDLQQALAVLGFGQSSYTVLGQGMVDRLLFFNAAERKVLFDEAAGVKQYEIKREQAMRKLEATDGNLIRLRDILTELEPRVVNLRRLVKRAEGRIEIEKELTEIQNRYYSAVEYELTSKIKNFEEKKASYQKEIFEKNKKIEKLSLEIAELSVKSGHDDAVHQLEVNISGLTEDRDEFMRKVSYIEGQLTLAEGRGQNVVKEQERLSFEKLEVAKKIEFIKSKIEEGKKELALEQKKREQIETICENLEQESAKLQEKLTSIASENQAVYVAELESKIEAAEKSRREVASELFSLQQREAVDTSEAERTTKRKDGLSQQITNLKAEITQNEAEIKAKNELTKSLETKIGASQKELDGVINEVAKIEKELIELVSQVDQENLNTFEKELAVVANEYREVQSLATSGKANNNDYIGFFKKLDNIFGKIKLITSSLKKDERDKIEEKLRSSRERQNEIQKNLNLALSESERAESATELAQARVIQLETRLKETTEELKSFEENVFVKVGKEQIKSLESELAKVNELINELSSALKDKKKSLDEKRHEIVLKRSEVQDKEKNERGKLYEVDLIIGRLKNTIENQEREIKSSENRLGELELKLVEYSSFSKEENKELEQELVNSKKTLDEKNALLAKLRNELSQILVAQREGSKAVFDSENSKRQLEREVSAHQQEINSIDLDEIKFTTRLEDLREELRLQEIKIEQNNCSEILDQQTKDLLRSKMENLRRRLETIGGVDPETVKEYEELDARNTEMSSQVTDLDKAKGDLEKVISELDLKIKKQFSEVFVHISEGFDRYFKILFDGGKASLTLGEDEEGNFGIEITANPPGKRNQSLNVLSGGERTLTSLALLFAILSINPSPFCVLDEVDAALDESNTLRFAKIIKDLALKTQFLVITHNRETMRAADTLYGVTMDAGQTSKLISIRLTEALENVKN